METIKYKVIKNKSQYNRYCRLLEGLVSGNPEKKGIRDEIELLTLLIEKWDEDHNTFQEVDPIRLLHSLMADHDMKSRDLVDLLDVSKGYVSEMLNYKKGLSKDVIRKLAAYFKVNQKAFNREYKLKVHRKSRIRISGTFYSGKKKARA